MRNQTPLVPGKPAFDITVYIVLNYYGSRLGRAYAETGDDEADEKTTIENILSGQYSHPIRVVAFNTAEGWARDVTEDIAQAVLSKAQHEHRSISIAAQESSDEPRGNEACLRPPRIAASVPGDRYLHAVFKYWFGVRPSLLAAVGFHPPFRGSRQRLGN